MRVRKIRGNSRVIKDIEAWRSRNLELNMDELKQRHRDYIKLWIHPYYSIAISDSEIPSPKGKIKQLMLEGLMDIHGQWKKQLDELGEPYYLRIWLNQHDFIRSQVVCAIGEFLDFYESTFYKPESQKQIPLDQFGKASNRLAGFDWEHRLDENHLREDDLGEPDEYISEKEYRDHLKWFKHQLSKNPRITTNSDGTKTYSVKQGVVWIGNRD